ncbi:MAG: hypothetical protein AB1696_03420 [Planctomycetota bacterium]
MNEKDRDEMPWTEKQWERFLRRSEVRSAKFQELFETLRDHPDQEEIISHEMGWDDPPERDDDFPDFDPNEMIVEPTEEEMQEYMERHDRDLHAISAYERAFAYTLSVHNALKDFFREDNSDADEALAEAIGQSGIIGAKIAGGHGMGYEDDVLCGNICCCKRSLEAADRCLGELERAKALGAAPREVIEPLITEGREVRRLVAEWITELRGRVWWDSQERGKGTGEKT